MTVQELAAHNCKKHKIHCAVRPYLRGTVCYACLKDSHTRAKLLNHVGYRSPKCRAYVTSCTPIDASIVFKLDNEDFALSSILRAKGKSILFHDLPSIRVPGAHPI